MVNHIVKSEESEELLKKLTELHRDLTAIEKLLQEKGYSPDAVSRAGFDYAKICWDNCEFYHNEHFEELRYSESKLIPDSYSANMLKVFKLLLKYGLDPNAVCEDKGESDTILSCVEYVFNEYVAADTLALLIEHGGDPFNNVSDESLFDAVDFDVIFGALNMEDRSIYDSMVHCWFVLLGYSDKSGKNKDLLTAFGERQCDCSLENFKISDLRQHRNYTFGISNVPSRGENWSLHIFDKRTRWEVARF